MKTRLLVIFSLILACCLLFLVGCGGGSAGSSSGNASTGTIAMKVAWSKNAAAKAVPGVKMMGGVVTVRFVVSGPGMTTITKDFPMGDGQGTIDGVPVGVERVLKVLGLDSSGVALYVGEVTNITVVAGQTSDVGTVVMESAYFSISGKVTIDGTTGLDGVTVTAVGPTSCSATTDANGDYTIWALPGGNYQLTPSRTDYTLTPSSTTVTISTASLTGQNFIGTLGTPYFPITIGNKWIYNTNTTLSTGETIAGTLMRQVTQVTTAINGFTVQQDRSEVSSTGSSTSSSSLENLLLVSGNGYLQDSTGSKIFTPLIGGSTNSTFSIGYTTPGYIVFIGQLVTGTIVNGSTTKTETITTVGIPSVNTSTITNQYEAIGPETVTVPAGTFSAIRVSFTETISAYPSYTTISGDCWYVPSIGLVKVSQTSPGSYPSYVTTTTTEELTSYIVH